MGVIKINDNNKKGRSIVETVLFKSGPKLRLW